MRVLSLLLALSFGLAAQAQSPVDPNVVPPPALPEAAPAAPNAAVAPVPVPTPALVPPAAINLPAKDFLEPYIFDAREGRRNPFRPFVVRGEDGESVAIGPATPLERFEVDELTLLAVMWDVKTPKAMIMDPQKNIHVITKDDRIGRKKGYVATIREGEIVIVETSEFNGEPVFSTRVIELKK